MLAFNENLGILEDKNKAASIITLTTDFGTHDPFVGSMKGVILKINPHVQIIDISHNINPFDLFDASFLISCAYKYYPTGTIHCIVIDPGVGSTRRPILALSDDYIFVAPDNGVLSYIYEKETIREVIHIKEHRFFLDSISKTFHGRDVFAPVSAWLTRGINPKDLGPKITDYTSFNLPKSIITEDRKGIKGQVIYIDIFGNLLTNIESALIEGFICDSRVNLMVKLEDVTIERFCRCYDELKKGCFGIIAGSQGYLELFASQDSLSRILGINKGAQVEVLINNGGL